MVETLIEEVAVEAIQGARGEEAAMGPGRALEVAATRAGARGVREEGAAAIDWFTFLLVDFICPIYHLLTRFRNR